MIKLFHLPLFLLAFAANAATCHWRGTDATSPTLASVAANWADGAVPADGDVVVLDADSGAQPLTWDLDDVTLASWTQTADYTGTVTFQTGLSRNANGAAKTTHGVLDEDGVTRILKVTGDIVVNGGVWTHTANPTMKSTEEAWADGKGIYRLLVKAGGNYTLGAGATNNVSLVGYASGTGPGYSTGDYSSSHGGLGIRVSYAYECWDHAKKSGDRPCYGSVKRPVTLGSGGNGRIGGGAVVLDVGGAATIAGRILANGGGSGASRNASGGSVQIKAGSITLTGEIACDGGYASNYGAGAGGRIALVTTDANATLDGIDRTKLHANAGTHKSNWASPGNGTIYFETAADAGRGELYLNGNGSQPDPCFGAGIHTATDDSDFRRVTFANKGMLALMEGGVLKVDELVGVADSTSKGVWMAGGTLVCGRPALTNDGVSIVASARSPFFFGHVATGGVIRVNGGSGVLRVRNDDNSVFQIDSPLTVDGDVEVADGAKIGCCTWEMMHKVYSSTGKGTYALKTETYNPTNRMELTIKGDLTIPAGAQVSAAGNGFSTGSGPGRPTVSGRYGASHGGRAIGYEQTAQASVPEMSPCYDDIRAPYVPGSGGSGGTGGGVIDLTVTGRLSLDGDISAAGSNASGSGPGSGGAIAITAGELVSPSGTGHITADAGTQSSSGYYAASGGGRVAVTLTKSGADFSDFGLGTGEITAYGSSVKFNQQGVWTASRYGGPGTVYLRTAAQAINEGTLLVANGESLESPSWADISADVASRAFGDVILRENAILHLDENEALSIKGSWTSLGGASLSNAANTTVTFVGPAAATISGTNEFCRLICEVPGKTLYFGGEDDSLLTVRGDGAMTLTGGEEEADYLVLRPAVSERPWPIRAQGGAALSVEHVDVAWSDASYGGKITAGNSKGNGANNVNWNFSEVYPGQIITWNGSAGDGWLTADNWDLERSPIATDLIVLPKGCPAYPVIAQDFVASNLTVASGASLSVSSTLTVEGGISMNGDLRGAGSLVLNAGAAVVFSDTSAAGFTGSIAIDVADSSRTLILGGAQLSSFTANIAGGTLSLPSGVNAAQCSVAGSGAVIFGGASSSVIDYLTIAGSAANALELSGDSGTTWKLKVARQARVDGVTCGGSDASKGISICATSSSAVGAANVNWRFGGRQCVWTGGAESSDWDTAGNWSSGVVPGADDVVILESSVADIVASTAVSAYDVFLTAGTLRLAEGGAIGNGVEASDGTTLTVDKPLAVANSVYLRSGSTLTHTANAATELR